MRTNPIFPVAVLIVLFLLMVAVAIFIAIRRRHDAPRSLITNVVLDIIIAVMVLMIGLRPMVPGGTIDTETSRNDLDIILVVDSTGSIIAEDYNGKNPRRDGVRHDVAQITEFFHGASFSIIAFDNSAYIRVPFTDNIETISNSINSLRPVATMYSNGSDLNSAFETLENTLESRAKKDGRQQVVFYFGDGEQTSDAQLDSHSGLAKSVAGGAVFGYGTEAGGKMLEVATSYESGMSSGEYITGYDYETYILEESLSKIDEENLKQIAGDLGVDYHHRTSPDSLDSVLKPMESLIKQAKTESGSKSVQTYDDIYWIFGLILGVALLLKIMFFLAQNSLKERN